MPEDFETVTLQRGNTFDIYHGKELQFYDDLPVNNYVVDFDKSSDRFILNSVDQFKLPEKIYGNVNGKQVERVLNTFEDRALSTGVLFSGVKGAGKTLLAKSIAVEGVKRGYPVVIVNKDWHGDKFNAFIQRIDRPAIVFFDEFEKIYDWSSQRKMLTLLDGVFPTKKLFLFTTNREKDILEFLRNRPGRIYYNFKFDVLTFDFVREYCQDALINKEHIEDIVKYVEIFPYFNFDMMVSVVEEMNRYGETLNEVLDILNIQPEMDGKDTYKLYVEFENEQYILDDKYEDYDPNSFSYHIYTECVSSTLFENRSLMEHLVDFSNDPQVEYDKIKDKELYVYLSTKNLVRFDHVNNRFVYELVKYGKKLTVVVERNESVFSLSKYHPALV